MDREAMEQFCPKISLINPPIFHIYVSFKDTLSPFLSSTSKKDLVDFHS
jgi:hypothetical protein